ncbi:MAG: cupin domain-containing protein [Gammaproteobacteria bacterium]|nr:cupin domain-containing protein [Gammaproteobacteria bacterium]HJN00007.1 cupin domain-containing protein [Gammaproteobacteria bacterium]
MRRIITGHNEEGKSVIKIDGPPPRTVGEDVGGLFEIWNTDGNAIESKDHLDRADMDIVLSPTEGGTKFRYFKINPTPEGVPMEVLESLAHEAFKKIGAEHERVDTTRHPTMHKTKTIDYIILLDGDVTLLLDDDEVILKPFDVVVQRGTNHAWINNGNKPALFIAVLIDSEINQ